MGKGREISILLSALCSGYLGVKTNKRKGWQNKFDRSYIAQSESTIDHVISLTHNLFYTPDTRLCCGEKLAKNWGKRHKTLAREAGRAVDWGGGKGGGSLADFFIIII